MKSGFENRRNVTILVVLLVLLAAAMASFLTKMLPGSGSPAAQLATAAAPASATQRANSEAGGHDAPKAVRLENLDPALHPELMAAAESQLYAGAGRNIFSLTPPPSKIEDVAGPIRPEPLEPPKPVGPPPPPPIDLRFYGYEAVGGQKKAFILHGEDVFIASEGDLVDHHYRILRINPLSVQVTNLLYNDTQTLPLT